VSITTLSVAGQRPKGGLRPKSSLRVRPRGSSMITVTVYSMHRLIDCPRGSRNAAERGRSRSAVCEGFVHLVNCHPNSRLPAGRPAEDPRASSAPRQTALVADARKLGPLEPSSPRLSYWRRLGGVGGRPFSRSIAPSFAISSSWIESDLYSKVDVSSPVSNPALFRVSYQPT
jgi:hypothetical protein